MCERDFCYCMIYWNKIEFLIWPPHRASWGKNYIVEKKKMCVSRILLLHSEIRLGGVLINIIWSTLY